MNGVWKLRMGTPGEGLLELAGASQGAKIPVQDGPCPLAAGRIECEQVRERFVLRVPLDPSERLYGLGLSFHGLTLNYGVRHLRADHYGGRDDGRTHAPVPFYASDAGYGVFVDTPENISFYMGGAVRVDAEDPPPERNRGRDKDWRCDQDARFVEASFVGTGADVYLIAGDTLKQVVSQFNLLCGGGCLPPKWGLGLWYRTPMAHDEAAVTADLAEFEAHGLHVDVLGLEPGWQSNSYPCTLEWDRERFPDPAAFVERLRRGGTRVNLWENMYISRKSGIYREILPYCGSHQVWGGAVPDVTLPEVREILLRKHGAERAGASGYKLDECDGFDQWLWPDHARFPSLRSATAVRNVYGVRLQRLMTELFRHAGERTYGLARAANAGSAPLPFCLYNDCYDPAEFLTGMASAGFCGVLWTPEVRKAGSAEEWARRFQLCALSPMLMLNAWASGAKPWQTEGAEEAVTQAVRFRRALLPYLYNAFYTYCREGVPPFRPLAMDYGAMRGGENPASGCVDDTANPYGRRNVSGVVDQFLIGDCLMAAPMLPGQAQREVLLPPGRWYDFHTGEPVEGESLLLQGVPMTRIPLWVKEGGMIPLLGEDGSLTVRCFGARGECALYDDDGETLRYEAGEYALLHLGFTRGPQGVEGRCRVESHGWTPGYSKITFS